MMKIMKIDGNFGSAPFTPAIGDGLPGGPGALCHDGYPSIWIMDYGSMDAILQVREVAFRQPCQPFMVASAWTIGT